MFYVEFIEDGGKCGSIHGWRIPIDCMHSRVATLKYLRHLARGDDRDCIVGTALIFTKLIEDVARIYCGSATLSTSALESLVVECVQRASDRHQVASEDDFIEWFFETVYRRCNEDNA